MNRILRGLSRANRTLGTIYSRAIGLFVSLLALMAGRGAWSAVETGQGVAAAVLGVSALALGAFAWWCFRPGKTLTDLVDS